MLISILTSTVLAMSATTGGATAQATPTTTTGKEIVVTGRRIRDARAALEACIASRCPPDKEIDASLALAETEIIAGKYRDARKTLLRTLSRHKDKAELYPVPVSDLYRANGRVAAHLGYDEDYYRSTWGIYRTLKKGLPSAEARHFEAKMEVAQMVARTRGHDRARLYYADIASEARAAGRPDIAAIAELRSAMRHLPPYMGKKIIREIAENRDPAMRAPSLEATLALARMAYDEGDIAEADAIQAQFARFKLKKPILVYSPPYQVVEGELGSGSEFNSGHGFAGARGFNPENPGSGSGGPATVSFSAAQFSTTKRMATNVEDMWMDVRFEITPGGKVENARISRSKGDKFWTRTVLESIRARRYTPSAITRNAERLERYTYTAAYEGKSETRMAGRSPAARIEYFDLSEEGATAQQ